MNQTFIHALNVTKIAKALLQLYLSHWQEKYRLDAQAFIAQLQKALEEYLNPPIHEEEVKYWNTIDNIERALKNLILSVNSFINLLSPEAQQHIEQLFTINP
jgi:hypothetical protein